MPAAVHITTHVLDVSRGMPAAGLAVQLEHRAGDTEEWQLVGRARTNNDGRVKQFETSGAGPEELAYSGQARVFYRLTFDTGAYFRAQNIATLYPAVVLVIETAEGATQYHVPLLLSPFGYTTYRGS